MEVLAIHPGKREKGYASQGPAYRRTVNMEKDAAGEQTLVTVFEAVPNQRSAPDTLEHSINSHGRRINDKLYRIEDHVIAYLSATYAPPAQRDEFLANVERVAPEREPFSPMSPNSKIGYLMGRDKQGKQVRLTENTFGRALAENGRFVDYVVRSILGGYTLMVGSGILDYDGVRQFFLESKSRFDINTLRAQRN